MAMQYTHRGSRRPGAFNSPQNWYPDPWGIAPWRWWDGTQWTPVLYGPYGEAWPLPAPGPPPFVPKGPGIMGGGVAAVGAGVGLVGSVAVVNRIRGHRSPADRRQRPVVHLGEPVRPVGRLRGRGRGRFTQERDGQPLRRLRAVVAPAQGPVVGTRRLPPWAGSCRFSC